MAFPAYFHAKFFAGKFACAMKIAFRKSCRDVYTKYLWSPSCHSSLREEASEESHSVPDSDRKNPRADESTTGKALEQLSLVWYRGTGHNQFGRQGTVRLRRLTTMKAQFN